LPPKPAVLSQARRSPRARRDSAWLRFRPLRFRLPRIRPRERIAAALHDAARLDSMNECAHN
jgi:hypothetical protein